MAEQRSQLQELYMENIRLNKLLHNQSKTDDELQEVEVQPEIDDDSHKIPLANTVLHNQSQMDDELQEVELKKTLLAKTFQSRVSKFCTWKTVIVVLVLLILFCSNGYLLHKAISSSDAVTETILEQQQLLKTLKAQGLIQTILGGKSDGKSVKSINVGMRNDYRLQECQGSNLKRTFPDLDYALFGYNILRGYPLAVGHDPGFTFPIFEADYSRGGQTADCRYSVPYGLVVVPDVSCVTSFSSKTVQTKYEFSKSLDVSASVSGGGWGVSFSASAGYKESSSEISTGESVFILSTAKCIYYFSKLVLDNAPRFSDTFLKWIYRLNNTETKDVYLDFFDTYGTHFLSYVTFGSRFTYEHKMTSNKFQSERSKGVNVAVQASYSGLFSAGGGFSMDSSQKESASSFSKSVETKTITIGAPPPANGDAMTWASTVKESPVPMEYTLVSFEKLFSENYMGKMNVNYTKISQNIERFKYEYCKYLKENGQLDSCESLTPGIILTKTRLFGHYKSKALSYAECIDFCLQDVDCEAITYCRTCPEYNQVCYMYAAKNNKKSADFTDTGNEWQSIIFVTKILNYFKFTGTNIIGNERKSENTKSCLNSMAQCKAFCIKDVHCIAYTFSSCSGKLKNCHLYSKNRIKSLKKKSGVNAYFMFKHEPTENMSTATTAPKTTAPSTTALAPGTTAPGTTTTTGE